MDDMRHGRPANEEAGIDTAETVFPKDGTREMDSFVFREEPLRSGTTVPDPVAENTGTGIAETVEPVEIEPAVPAAQTDAKKTFQPFIKKKMERKEKERPLKKEKTANREKKRLSRSALVLIIGIIIIAIPVLIFAGILGISALQTGTPRIGSRFDGDLEPAITDSDVTALEADLSSISSLDSVEVILSQGQLKIFIDTNDTLSEEQIDSILMSAYNKVISRLPISTYFTGDDSRKMYDLQINVYTSAAASPIGDENGRQYKLLHKNSTEETYGIDDMAHPKDPALAAELEGLVPEVSEEEIEEGDGE